MDLELLSMRQMGPEKQREFLKHTMHQADKMDFLIQSIIKMSRLESGAIRILPQNADFARTLANALLGVSAAAERQRDASLMLGFRNLRSEGKKSVLVIVSLFLSLTLLNTTYTVLRGFDLEQFVKSYTNGDFEVTDWIVNAPGVYEKNLEGIDSGFEEAVSQMPGLTRFEKVYCEEGWADLSESVLKDLEQEIEQGKDDSDWLSQRIEMRQDMVQIYTASDALAESLDYEAGAFDAEKWAKGEYLIYYDIKQWRSEWLYQLGEKLRLEGSDGKKRKR